LEDETELTEPPLTAIEILSPTRTIYYITTDKFFNSYFPAGVQSAWLVVPTFRTIYVYTPDWQYTTFVGNTLHDPATDITLPLNEIFP
jgi:Uma2 family endonuclease